MAATTVAMEMAAMAADEFERCRLEIEHRGIYRCPPGASIPAKFGGQPYHWCFYLRRCLFDQAFVTSVARQLLERQSLDGYQIGACEAAGVPIAIALAQASGRPMFTVKKEPKAYALRNRTEGRIADMPVVLVDDLAGSQSTLRIAERFLTTSGLEVAPFYMAIVHKTQHTHTGNLLQRRLVSLYDCGHFTLHWQVYAAKHGRDPDFGRWL
jgi:orotate phosphoribosyltransferase